MEDVKNKKWRYLIKNTFPSLILVVSTILCMMHQKRHFTQQQLVFPETGQFTDMLLMCYSHIYLKTGLAAWLDTWLDKVKKIFYFLLGWTDLINIQQCWIILQVQLLKDRVLNQIDSQDWRKLDVKLLVGGPGAWTARKMISLDAAVSMS